MNMLAEKFNKIKQFVSAHRKKLILIGFPILAVIALVLGILVPQGKLGLQNAKQPPPQYPNWQTYDESVQNGEIDPVEKILEVTLQYNQSSSPRVSVTSLERKNGYPSRNELPGSNYIAQLLGPNNKILAQYEFNIDNKVHTDIVNPDGSLSGEEITLPQVTSVINLPWSDTAKRILVRDKNGIIAALSVENIPYTDNKPEVETIQGDKLLINKKEKLNFRLVPQAYAAQTKKLGIVFISDGKLDAKSFEDAANKFADRLLSYEPFKSRASQIQFYRFKSDDNFQCKLEAPSGGSVSDATTRHLSCDNAAIKKAVNTKGAPTDFVALVSKESFRQTTGEIIKTHNNTPESADAFVHEIGHLVGTLIEEYIFDYFIGKNGPMDNQAHYTGGDGNALTNPAGEGNCYAGKPPAKAWEGLVKTEDYKEGCTYPNWYRGAKNSIMHDMVTFCFSKPAQRVINKRLDKLAGPSKEIISECSKSASGSAQISPAVTPEFVCLGGRNCKPKESSSSGQRESTCQEGFIEKVKKSNLATSYWTQVDANGDGTWDQYKAVAVSSKSVDVYVDTNGDGKADFIGHDYDGNRLIDDAHFDNNFDGKIETYAKDKTGDGWQDDFVPVAQGKQPKSLDMPNMSEADQQKECIKDPATITPTGSVTPTGSTTVIPTDSGPVVPTATNP